MHSTCVPNEQSPLAEQLDAALSTLHAEYTLVDEQEYAEEESGTIDADPNVRNFSYTVKDDVIYYRENSKMRAVKGGETALARIRALVPLRDTCRELIDAQLENFPDEYIQKLQVRLNDQYDAYRKKYGLSTAVARHPRSARIPATSCSAPWKIWTMRETSRARRICSPNGRSALHKQ